MLKCAVLSHDNATDVSSFVGVCNWQCYLQECPPELLPNNLMFIFLPYAAPNVVFENLAVCPTSITTADHGVWCHVGQQFADVNVVNRVPDGGGGVMVQAGISY